MVCMISKFSSSSSEFSNGCPSADSKDYNKKNASIMFILNIVCNKPDFKENLCKIIHFMFPSLNFRGVPLVILIEFGFGS